MQIKLFYQQLYDTIFMKLLILGSIILSKSKAQYFSNIMTFLYEMNMLIIRIHNRGFEILHPSVHDDYLLLCFKYYTACFLKKIVCIQSHRQKFWSNLPYNIRGYNRNIFFWNFLILFLLLSYIIVKYAVPAIIKFERGNGWSV